MNLGQDVNVYFRVNNEERLISCILQDTRNGWVRNTNGHAKCMPEDDFDITLGKSLALSRAAIRLEEKLIKETERIKKEANVLCAFTLNNIENLSDEQKKVLDGLI